MKFDFKSNRPESLRLILEARDKQREEEKKVKGSDVLPFKV